MRVHHAPRTPSDWPTLASTQRRPHFRRVDPFLATQPAKGTRLLYRGPYPILAGLFDHIGPTAHHTPSEFHRILYLCSRRRRPRTICLMSMVWFSRPLSSPSTKKPPRYSNLREEGRSFAHGFVSTSAVLRWFFGQKREIWRFLAFAIRQVAVCAMDLCPLQLFFMSLSFAAE